MAPELRRRKAVSEAQKSHGAPSKIAEKSTKAKRKAADDASPVTVKKQKSAKKTTGEKKTVAKDQPKKPGKKVEAKKQEVEAEAARAEDESDSDEQDTGMLLLADELDSGDEEVADKGALFKPGQDVGKVPAISKEAMETAKPSTGERGVIYIGRIPHGFYEHEMRQYLTQFGPVTRLRLSRNKKTGASKHFAFVEFEEESTAEIVAKTMDNYLLFGHILKVKMVPKSQVHEELFKGANKRFKKVPWNKLAGRQLAKPRTESAWEAKVERQRADRAKTAAKLKAMGYDFEVPGLKDVPAPRPKEEEEVKAIEAGPMEDETGDGPDEAEAKEPEGNEREGNEQEGNEPEPEAKTPEATTPKAKMSKAKTSKAKTSKAKTSKAKTSKAKTSKSGKTKKTKA